MCILYAIDRKYYMYVHIQYMSYVYTTLYVCACVYVCRIEAFSAPCLPLPMGGSGPPAAHCVLRHGRTAGGQARLVCVGFVLVKRTALERRGGELLVCRSMRVSCHSWARCFGSTRARSPVTVFHMVHDTGHDAPLTYVGHHVLLL